MRTCDVGRKRLGLPRSAWLPGVSTSSGGTWSGKAGHRRNCSRRGTRGQCGSPGEFRGLSCHMRVLWATSRAARNANRGCQDRRRQSSATRLGVSGRNRVHNPGTRDVGRVRLKLSESVFRTPETLCTAAGVPCRDLSSEHVLAGRNEPGFTHRGRRVQGTDSPRLQYAAVWGRWRLMRSPALCSSRRDKGHIPSVRSNHSQGPLAGEQSRSKTPLS
jgi:hypothetical protein